MDNLDNDIAFYESKKGEFEGNNMGRWILVHNSEVIGFYDNFEAAAQEAVQKFGAGPYLIRQIGVNSITLPASVMYNI
jgi:hypothetical protein